MMWTLRVWSNPSGGVVQAPKYDPEKKNYGVFWINSSITSDSLYKGSLAFPTSFYPINSRGLDQKAKRESKPFERFLSEIFLLASLEVPPEDRECIRAENCSMFILKFIGNRLISATFVSKLKLNYYGDFARFHIKFTDAPPFPPMLAKVAKKKLKEIVQRIKAENAKLKLYFADDMKFTDTDEDDDDDAF